MACVLLLTCYRKRESYELSSIDIVYTWVYEDEALMKDIRNYSPTAISKGTYKSNDELKFSLRSLERYAPWYNKIYIVVRDGQKPNWLRTNGRLEFVEHSKIIPSKYLPTFNSLVIESFLHKIPNLSEKYIYFNDDVFLWNAVTPSMFFTIEGKTLESGFTAGKNKVPSSLKQQKQYSFWRMIRYNIEILQQEFPPLRGKLLSIIQHTPTPQRVSVNNKLDNFLGSVRSRESKGTSVDEYTKLSRFRQNENIARNSIFKKYFYLLHDYAIENHHLRSEIIKVTNKGITKKDEYILQYSKNPFLCIQNETNSLFPAVDDSFQQVKLFLTEKFPLPCCHEIIP